MLKYNIPVNLWRIITIISTLEKEQVLTLKKDWTKYTIKVDNFFKAQENKKCYELLKELNILLTGKWIDNTNVAEDIQSEISEDMNYHIDKDIKNKIPLIWMRDIKKDDLMFFIELYNTITKTKIFLSPETIKKDFFLFIKQMNTIDMDEFLQVLKDYNFNFLLAATTNTDWRDSKTMAKILLVLANYSIFLEDTEYKYISKLTNFIKWKYIDYSLFDKTRISSIIKEIKRLFLKIKELDIPKKWFFSILWKMDIKTNNNLAQKEEEIEAIKEDKPVDDLLGDLLSSI